MRAGLYASERPQELQQGFALLRRPFAPRSPAPALAASDGFWPLRAVLVALALFAAAQVALPLRHWAYPGNVRWNEDGYRFAWRVMLIEKAGHVRFRVTDAATGERWLERPESYLMPLQAERMAYQPDMILATVHIVAERWQGRGREVQVRADAFVSVNGRRAARLVDADVDLARVEPGLGPSWWALPAPPDF